LFFCPNFGEILNLTLFFKRWYKIFSSHFQIGPAELDIEWAGPLVSTLVGINKVTYTDQGEMKYIIATKFEPTYAREAFPCFDEPALKAKFDLVMYHENTHSKSYTKK